MLVIVSGIEKGKKTTLGKNPTFSACFSGFLQSTTFLPPFAVSISLALVAQYMQSFPHIFGEALGNQEVEVSAQPFLSAALCILLFSSAACHFLIISCAPVWSIHGLLYTSGLPCLGKGHFMGPSPSGVVTTPVPPQAAVSVGPFLPYCGIIPDPQGYLWSSRGSHGQRLLCQTSTPSKSAFPAGLCQCPLTTSLPFQLCRQTFSHFSLHILFLYFPVFSFTPPMLSLFCGLMCILHQCLPPFLIPVWASALSTSLTGWFCCIQWDNMRHGDSLVF